MELTKEQIKQINEKCPYDQGIFTEPYGIPNTIKEPVIYMRWSPGGVSGGSCWDSSDPQPYYNREKEGDFKVLDLVLEILKPNISYLEYKKISELIVSSEETEWEYYGNCTDWNIKYIILSDLIKLLK